MDNLCEISEEEFDQNLQEINKNESINEKKSPINELSKYETISRNESPTNQLSQLMTTSSSLATSPLITTSSSLATSPLKSPNASKSLSPEQTIRSELRRDFLRLLSSVHKHKVWLKLYECPLTLSANFEGCDANFNHLFLTSFQTPIGLEKYAIVRTNDIIELQFNLNNKQNNQQNQCNN
jgi:hypothetical protein